MVHFKAVRKGHAITLKHKLHKRDPTCDSPLLYKSPSTGDTIQASDPFTITWDTSYASCLGNGATNIDIYLLSPAAQSGHVKIFSSIPFSAGTYTKTLDPSWWGGNNDIQLTVNFSPTGQPLALSPFAGGPVVNVKSTGTSSSGNSDSSSDPTIKTSGDVVQGGSLPKGSIAAAILLPIIAVLIGLGIYIKMSRKKQAERSRRFSQVLHARMSRISGDWQQMAQDNSMFGVRESTASGLRMSAVVNEGMHMDVRQGAERVSIANMPYSSSQPVGSRTSRFNPPTVGTRQSRISFAPDVNASKERLSTYTTGRNSRAFQLNDAPPVPRGDFGRAIPENTASIISASVYDVNSIYAVESHEQHEESSPVLSPTQTQGPVALSNDDINNIDIAPALSLMRTTGNPAAKSTDDLLLTPPAPPTPTHVPGSPLGASSSAPPLSPLGAMPMRPQQASAMSPDDMLRQYAKAKAYAAKSSLASNVTSPSAVYSPTTPTTPSFTANGMRNLTGDASLSH